MKHFNYERAVKRYNDIMMSVCYEHSTIGTRFSEGTDEWNVRDMVAECDYVLSTYYEVGHCNEELRHSEEPDERKVWYSETGKLRRFIDAYEPFIDGVFCTQGHCSKFDNHMLMSVAELIGDAVVRSNASCAENNSLAEPIME